MFTETALFLVVHKLEKSLNHKGMALGAFMDIEGAFDNTSFTAIITAAGSADMRKLVAVGSGPCLKQTGTYLHYGQQFDCQSFRWMSTERSFVSPLVESSF